MARSGQSVGQLDTDYEADLCDGVGGYFFPSVHALSGIDEGDINVAAIANRAASRPQAARSGRLPVSGGLGLDRGWGRYTRFTAARPADGDNKKSRY